MSLCKNANPIEVAWRDLLCAYDDLVKWFYGCFCNDEIDEMINWPWCFLSAQGNSLHHETLFRKNVMIGSGVLIQMRFTLSMVNRFYGNVFRIRTSILILVVFVLVAGYL